MCAEGAHFESSLESSWLQNKFHCQIRVTEAAATILHLDIFYHKLMPKNHPRFAGKTKLGSVKKRGTTGGTVLIDRGRTCQTLKIQMHCPKGGLVVFWVIRYHKTQPDVHRRVYRSPRVCMLFLILRQQVSQKFGTKSSKLTHKFCHLKVMAFTTEDFTILCDPPEIFLQLSHS